MDLSRAVWRKSSHSAEETNCIEVAVMAAGWRKSSHSGTETNCVEVAAAMDMIAVRDSKDLDGPVLAFAPSAWRALLTRTKTSAAHNC